MNNALVSIIVPIYNQAEFVRETIESLCAQTHRRVQIIVVDDGSTDGSAEILENTFSGQIELVRQENRGPSAATNEGFKRVRGDFIALMGGDDICKPDRIAQQLHILSNSELDLIFSTPNLINERSYPISDSQYPVFFQALPEDNAYFAKLFWEDNFLCAPSAMFRTSVATRIGKFHEGLIQLQDYDYWLRAVGLGYKIGVFDHRLVSYRRHQGNLSSAARELATIAEFPIILGSILDNADPAVLRKTFGQLLEPLVDTGQVLSCFEKSIVLLAHRRRDVQMLGLSKVIGLMNDSAAAQKYEERGVNLFRYIYNAGQAINS